jgi:BioD-like phosphotransacetylase family protein
MTTLIISSPLARDGKSVVAAGLALTLRQAGSTVRLVRSGQSQSATIDAATFAQLQGVRTTGSPEPLAALQTDTDLTIVETDALASAPDDAASLQQQGAILVLVTRHGQADDYTVRGAIEAMKPAAIVINGVPAAALDQVSQDAESYGLPVLAVLPQDRLLAAPSFRAIADAIQGQLSGPEDLHQEAAEWLTVGPVSAHGGIPYFDVHPDQTVITRHDRVDIALSALRETPIGLILTGGEPQLPYVHERAESEAFALIITPLNTADVTNRIGDLYTHTPFIGQRKLRRAVTLVQQHSNPDSLAALTQIPAS